MHRTLVVLG